MIMKKEWVFVGRTIKNDTRATYCVVRLRSCSVDSAAAAAAAADRKVVTMDYAIIIIIDIIIGNVVFDDVIITIKIVAVVVDTDVEICSIVD